jgi:endogenous inhibitor of DNA gyrase (YacG/DUF329 family)
MPRVFCPTCKQEFDSEKSPALPFCSQRCRLIDLGRWLNEEYSMPIEREPELDEFHEERRED